MKLTTTELNILTHYATTSIPHPDITRLGNEVRKLITSGLLAPDTEKHSYTLSNRGKNLLSQITTTISEPTKEVKTQTFVKPVDQVMKVLLEMGATPDRSGNWWIKSVNADRSIKNRLVFSSNEYQFCGKPAISGDWNPKMLEEKEI